MLRTMSQTWDIKLHDVAQRLMETTAGMDVAPQAPFNDRGGKPPPGR